MEFERKYEVQYLDGTTILHTFRVLSNDQRNNIFGEFLDMKAFMSGQGKEKDTNPMEYILEGKNILDFTKGVLQASCPTLETNKIPSYVSDKLFEELNDFIFTGGIKN